LRSAKINCLTPAAMLPQSLKTLQAIGEKGRASSRRKKNEDMGSKRESGTPEIMRALADQDGRHPDDDGQRAEFVRGKCWSTLSSRAATGS
jgi:hypothetical protein